MKLLAENVAGPKVKALLSMGWSKLLLAGLITDREVQSFYLSTHSIVQITFQVIRGLIRDLILVYLHPSTRDNQELRQCLTFFFPAYSYSSTVNQKIMTEVCIIWNLHAWNLTPCVRFSLKRSKASMKLARNLKKTRK